MESHERKAYPRSRKQASRTPSAWSKVMRKEGLSSSEEASKRDSICPERSRVKGRLVLARGSKQVGLHLPGVKSHERKACPRLRKQASGTPSTRSEVARKEGLSSLEEANKRDSVCPERSHAKRKLLASFGLTDRGRARCDK